MYKKFATATGLALSILLCALFGMFLFRATIIEFALISVLKNQGLEQSSLSVTKANLTEIELETIALSSSQLKADRARITYSWSSLRDGGLKLIKLSDLQISGTWTEDGVDFGGGIFSKILSQSTKSPETENTQSETIALPFETFVLENAAFTVLLPEGQIEFITNLEVENNAAGLNTLITAELSGPDLNGSVNISGDLYTDELLSSSLSGTVKLFASSFNMPGSKNSFSADIDIAAAIKNKVIKIEAARDLSISAPWPAQLATLGNSREDSTLDVVLSNNGKNRPFIQIESLDNGYRGELNIALSSISPMGSARLRSSAWATFGADELPQDFRINEFDLQVTEVSTQFGTINASLNASGMSGPLAIAGGPIRVTADITNATYGDVSSERILLDTAADFRLDGLSLAFDFQDFTAVAGTFQYADQLTGSAPLAVTLATDSSNTQTTNLTFGEDGSATLTFDNAFAVSSKELQINLENSALFMDAALPDVSIEGYWKTSEQDGEFQLGIKNGLLELGNFAIADFFVSASSDMSDVIGTYSAIVAAKKDNDASTILLRTNGGLNKEGSTVKIEGSTRLPSRKLIAKYGIDYDLASTIGALRASSGPLLFGGQNIGPSDLRHLDLPFIPTAGEFAATLSVVFNSGELKQQEAQLLFKEMEIESSQFAIRRLNSAIEFESLIPAKTKGSQNVAVGMLDIGLPITDVLASFSIDSLNAIEVDSISMKFADGNVSGGPFSLRLDGNKTFAQFSVNDISLPALAFMTGLNGLQATGVLSGQIPVLINGSDIVITSGKLKTSGPGAIQYIANGTAEAAANDGGGMALALQALEDFQYDSLEVTVTGSVQSELEASLAIKGRNPELYDGYPIDFNLNLSGELANIIQGSMAGYRVPEAIKRQLTDFPPRP